VVFSDAAQLSPTCKSGTSTAGSRTMTTLRVVLSMPPPGELEKLRLVDWGYVRGCMPL